VSLFVVVVPLREGAREQVRSLLRGGPPFALPQTPLTRHDVFLTDREAVFVFEGPDAREEVQRLASDPALWRAAASWHDLLAGRPRIAQSAFSWTRE
jgi:hypothetical protein